MLTQLRLQRLQEKGEVGAFWAGKGLIDKEKHKQRLEGKKEHSTYGEWRVV